MAEATRQYTGSVLSAADMQYLRELPRCACRQVGGDIFFLCHATPSDPLYEYRPPDSPLWAEDEESSSGANIVLAGHTHLPFSRACKNRVVINPGSLGQSKAGDPRARFRFWDEGKIELDAVDYEVEKTMAKIAALPLDDQVKRDLPRSPKGNRPMNTPAKATIPARACVSTRALRILTSWPPN